MLLENKNMIYHRQEQLSRYYLLLCTKMKCSFKLTVDGTSMIPILNPGDSIVVCPKEEYVVGDILVFYYKNDDLLVHRLLQTRNGRLLCKGDNSFRMEDILPEQIIGAVQLEYDSNRTEDFIAASLQINKIFRKCGYNSDLIRQHPTYIEYKNKYIEIQKNE